MKEIITDVAVVALGPAGLAAAIQAAEEGLEVVAFEKANVAGGTANIAVGPFGVETKQCIAGMHVLTKEEALRIQLDYTHWTIDARLLREYFWKSADTIDWLCDMGVQFEPARYYPHSYWTWHRVKPEDGGPAGARTAAFMTKHMAERAEDVGVEIYYETPVREILRSDDGVVHGLIAVDKNGEEIRCEAKAVIVATGGFGDSPEMMKEYVGYTYGKDMFNFRVAGLKGDGCNMVWKIGGAKGKMSMERFVGTTLPHPECVGVNTCCLQPHMIVNLEGERFFDEGLIENPAEALNAVDRQTGRKAFVLFSDEILREYKRNGLDFPAVVRPGDHVKLFYEQVGIALEQCPDQIIISEDLREVADHFGINYETLKDSLDEYNEMAAMKYDDLFGKKRKYMRPVRGKYICIMLTGRAYGTLGGIKINWRTEVLDTENKPIPGLYAAGSDTCEIYDGTYLYLLPGNTMGYALNTGRIAAERAAEYIEKRSV